MGLGIGIKTRVRRNRVRGAFVGLLDQPFASGATAAYSLRLLRAKHSGGLIRSRADDAGTSKGEADVLPLLQPDGSKIIELNSPIENLNSKAQTRLGTPQGGGDKVLADLVDAGGSNYDGFASNWYGQTANQNDATQGTASNQPKIVNSGNIVKENSKPALDFDGSDYLSTTPTSTIPLPIHLFRVFIKTGSRTSLTADTLTLTNDNKFKPYDGYDDGRLAPSNNSGFVNLGAATSQILLTTLATTSLITEYKNSSLVKNLTHTFKTGVSNQAITIASRDDQVTFMKGKIQETVLFNSDKSSNRTQIENNINNYFSIY